MFVYLTNRSVCSNRRMCWSSPLSSYQWCRPLFVRTNLCVRDNCLAIQETKLNEENHKASDKSSVELSFEKIKTLFRWSTVAAWCVLCIDNEQNRICTYRQVSSLWELWRRKFRQRIISSVVLWRRNPREIKISSVVDCRRMAGRGAHSVGGGGRAHGLWSLWRWQWRLKWK